MWFGNSTKSDSVCNFFVFIPLNHHNVNVLGILAARNMELVGRIILGAVHKVSGCCLCDLVHREQNEFSFNLYLTKKDGKWHLNDPNELAVQSRNPCKRVDTPFVLAFPGPPHFSYHAQLNLDCFPLKQKLPLLK